MGLIDIASNNSFWRGLDYYESGYVETYIKIADNQYKGQVRGSRSEPYEVTIDIEHPKKSTCNCPHAEGMRRICKHKVALYFTIFPDEANRAKKEAEEYEAAEELRQEELYGDIERYVNSLSVDQLREELIIRLLEEEDADHWW